MRVASHSANVSGQHRQRYIDGTMGVSRNAHATERIRPQWSPSTRAAGNTRRLAVNILAEPGRRTGCPDDVDTHRPAGHVSLQPTSGPHPPPGTERRVWLLGLMGSGKSVVGEALAARLTCRYIDNDATITDLAGATPVVLARAGGSVLHTWEAVYVRHVIRLDPPLVAGLPASTADRAGDLTLLVANGFAVYLRADPETLSSRVRSDPERPWLDHDVEAKISDMFVRRDPAFRAFAAAIVDATRPVDELLGEVMALLNGSL
jgi:shikimate kinase